MKKKWPGLNKNSPNLKVEIYKIGFENLYFLFCDRSRSLHLFSTSVRELAKYYYED